MKAVPALAVVTMLLLTPSPGRAQTSGTYVLQGSSYSLSVRFGPGGLTVIEPNKESLYTMVGPNEYHFRNPANGILYGLRVLDAESIQAFKPGTDVPPTTLKLASPAAAAEGIVESDELMAVAEKYRDLSVRDPVNVQAWVTCSAAALTRATLDADDADSFIREAVPRLRALLVNESRNPCEDAIPAHFWTVH